MARTSKAKKTVDVANRTVTFESPQHGDFVAALDKLPDAIRTRLALHGLSQKCGDSYAGDVANPIHEAISVYEDLAAGLWTTRAESAGPRTTLLAEAIARVKTYDVAAVQTALEDYDDDAIAALRKNPAIVAAMESIKAERASERAAKANAAAGDGGVDFDL